MDGVPKARACISRQGTTATTTAAAATAVTGGEGIPRPYRRPRALSSWGTSGHATSGRQEDPPKVGSSRQQSHRPGHRRRWAHCPLSGGALLLVAQLLSMAPLPPRLLLAAGALRPQSDLSSNCFGFPERNFDPWNNIKAVNDGHTPYLPMNTGDFAVDFTLHDLAGNAWNLASTLEETGKPVVMIWGMFTCPGFQGYGTEPPWDMDSYGQEQVLVETHKDRATFVHLYGPEPHPRLPGTNFDKGIVWPHFWSTVSQHKTYKDRLDMAQQISSYVHPEQVILPDYFPGNPYSDLIQPVWCTYAMAARAVVIVSPEGKIIFQRAWFHAGHVGRAIEHYWCEKAEEAGWEGFGDDGRTRSGLPEALGSAAPTLASCPVDVPEDEDWGDDGPPLA